MIWIDLITAVVVVLWIIYMLAALCSAKEYMNSIALRIESLEEECGLLKVALQKDSEHASDVEDGGAD